MRLQDSSTSEQRSCVAAVGSASLHQLRAAVTATSASCAWSFEVPSRPAARSADVMVNVERARAR